MLLRGRAFLFGMLCFTSASGIAWAQSLVTVGPEGAERFEVSVIRPTSPTGPHGGVIARQGHIIIGAKTLVDLVAIAYDCKTNPIERGPAWVRDNRFDIEATYTVKESQDAPGRRDILTPAERHMLQHMLEDRFGLRLASYSKPSPVLFLVKTGANTRLQPPQHGDVHPSAGFMISSQGVATGEAMGRNITMGGFAHEIELEMSKPVFDRTGLTASYDFSVQPTEPNGGDEFEGVSTALRMLGLGLKPGTAPVRHWVIAAVSQPDQN